MTDNNNGQQQQQQQTTMMDIQQPQVTTTDDNNDGRQRWQIIQQLTMVMTMTTYTGEGLWMTERMTDNDEDNR